MTERTKVVSIHKLRRAARARERAIETQIRNRGLQAPHELAEPNLPVWACGVRVEKAGWFQWAVVATEHRGH